MTTTRLFHRGYMISCRPQPTDDGRHEARAVIVSMDGDKTRSQTFLDLETFDTESLAVVRAQRAGIEWIDAVERRRQRDRAR